MKMIKNNFNFGILVERKTTKRAIIHHSGSDTDTVETIHNYHTKSKRWSGIGYHIVIDQEGLIYEGRPFEMIGAHTLGENEDSIGICVLGDLDNTEMKQEQKDSLREVLKWLIQEYEGIQIYTHSNFIDTSCPGENFDTDIIVEAYVEEPTPHWAEPIYNKLVEKGLTIHEKRFDDKITRGEAMALIMQLMEFIEIECLQDKD